MRITMFRGMRPQVAREELQQQFAVLAENVDFYSRSLRPFRKPALKGDLVDLFGRKFEATPKAMMRVGHYFVGLINETHWVKDPTGKGVVFVSDGKLWRITEALIRSGKGPTRVGANKPDKILTTLVLRGLGCYSEWPPHDCAPGDCEDTHAQLEHMTSYRYSYLNDCNEEGPPSQPSEPVPVKNGDAVSMTRQDTNADNAVAWRVYRSVVTTDSKVVWLHVDDVPIAQKVYIDKKCPLELGEALSDERVVSPPDCLDGVSLAGNRQIAVWAGADFWVSRCDSTALFPTKFHSRLPDPIVFMAGYTTIPEQDTHYELNAVTTKRPYAIELQDDYPHIREIPEWYPALDPFAWGYFRGGIVYSSLEGVVHIVQGVARYITAEFMTHREWSQYNPRSARYTQWGERLFVWVDKHGLRRGLLFGFSMHNDVREGDMTEITLAASMALSDVDEVNLLIGNHVYLWQGSTEAMRMLWRSHDSVQTGWTFPSSIKVVGDLPRKDRGLMQAMKEYTLWKASNTAADPEEFFDLHCQYIRYKNRILAALQGTDITVYLDGDVLYSRRVLSQAPMRIPRRYHGQVWAVEVTGYREVNEIHMQTSHYDMVQEGGHA